MLGGLCAAAMAIVDLSKMPLSGRVIFAASTSRKFKILSALSSPNPLG
jgi:hypothetical protein